MKKTINIILAFTMILLSIGVAIGEAYYIIIKNIFGMNVLKYALCGLVCFLIIELICIIFSLFIKEKETSIFDEDSFCYNVRHTACWIHIISFVISSVIMVMFFMDGGSKILGLILINLFTMFCPVAINSSAGPYIEEQVLARIYDNNGRKIGEIRK